MDLDLRGSRERGLVGLAKESERPEEDAVGGLDMLGGGGAGICGGGQWPRAQGTTGPVNRVAVQESRGHPGPGFAWEKEMCVTMGALHLWSLEAGPTHLQKINPGRQEPHSRFNLHRGHRHHLS